MAVTLNASTSSGFIQTADTSGDLALQSNGTTQFNVTSTGAYGQLKFSTAVTTTSGTSVDFTNIPSWAKRITVMFDGVSTNGTANYQIQLGTSGGFDIASYVSWSGIINTASAANANGSTTGFIVSVINAVADAQTGSVQITNLTGNTWVSSGIIARDGAVDGVVMSAGSKTLSGALTQVRVISSATGSPSGTFDAGTINILYEG
jgi:hypothetical protein